MRITTRIFPLIAALILLGMNACSLAEDVTPPPDYQPPTAVPSESPIQTEIAAPVQSSRPTLALEATPSAAENSTNPKGSVTGSVSNGSGGALPPGLTATLHGYDAMTESHTQSAPVNDDGSYVFKDVDMPSGRVFLVTVDYQGSTYSSDITQLQQDSLNLTIPVSIYDSTSDTSGISVDRLHLFFDFSVPDTLQVITLYVVSNTGNKTVVPAESGEAVLKFRLPSGAQDLQFQSGALGDRYVHTADGFGDTQPIPPGVDQHQVLYAYSLPYTGSINLDIPVSQAVKSAVILIPSSGVKLQSSQLQDSGSQSVQGASYRVFSADGLAAEDQIHLTLSGMPKPETGSSLVTGGSTPGLLVGLGAFALAVLGAFYWMWRQRAGRIRAIMTPETPGQAVTETQEELLDAIITLDDLHKAGKLPDAAYQEHRAELKERLKALTR